MSHASAIVAGRKYLVLYVFQHIWAQRHFISGCSFSWGVTFKIRAIQIYFLPFGSKDRSVSALSPGRGRILSNLSCLMKNSVSWPPISAVSGCYVRYRGGGAGKRGGNCFGLQQLYDQYYHRNGPHTPEYFIAAFTVHIRSKSFVVLWMCMYVCVRPWVCNGSLW